MLLDSCAAVCVGPTMALTHENLMLEKSKCRIITADGSIVNVDGTLGFFFEDPNNIELTVNDDFNLLLQMLNGAKDFLLSLPELSGGGFRTFLNRQLGKSFLVFPNGYAVVLNKESDNTWSLMVAVYLREDGSLSFGLAEGELYKMVSEPVFTKVRDIPARNMKKAHRVTFENDASPVAGDESLKRMNQLIEGSLALPLEEYDMEEYTWRTDDDGVGPDSENIYDGSAMFDPIHGCEKRVAGSIFDPIEDGSPFESGNADDSFVGSLRNANPVTNGGVVENNSVICNMCKQDVSSFVGLVSCVCSMESGLEWDGLPRWVYEESRKSLGADITEYHTAVPQSSVGVNMVHKEESLVHEEGLWVDQYGGCRSLGENSTEYHTTGAQGSVGVNMIHKEGSLVHEGGPLIDQSEERFGYAVCSLCQYEAENGLEICRACAVDAMYTSSGNYGDYTEEDLRRLDPFREVEVDEWLQANGYSEKYIRSYCQRCSVEIIAGDYCVNCAQVLGLQGLSTYDNEVVSAFVKRGVDTEGKEARDIPSEEVRRKLAQLAHGRTLNAEGAIPGRFPIIKDPKRFHLANGHPNDEVTRKLCESSFGDPLMIQGYANKCTFCLSRRRRIQPKKRVETVDRVQWRMGEKWTLDFTAMCLRKSHDNNAVGILFEESVSRIKVGQALPDHTHICTALDFLWNYVKTEKRGTQLRCLYADCDPIWFSVDELKMFLRKVGRWCFTHDVALCTNVPGQSAQNGMIEGSMGQVMSLTSVQLQCSFLNELYWDRSFLLAIFILGRRNALRSKSQHVQNSWHKIPWTVWSGRFSDITVMICAFGQALILKNDKKNNRFTRQGELGLWMGIPHKKKGWLVWNVTKEKYEIRYNLKVIKDMFIRPAMLGVRNQLTSVGCMTPKDDVLMGQNILGILQGFDSSRTPSSFNDEVIAFSRHDGQPVKVMTFIDIEEESLECYFVDGMELPDGLNLGEGKVADGDDESKEEGILQEQKEPESFPDGVDGNLRLFEVDDGVSLEDPRTGLNQTGIHSKLVLNAAQSRWFDAFWKDDTNQIKFQVANPKKPHTQTWHRWEKYKNAKDVGEMKRATGIKGDLTHAFCRGQCILPDKNSVQIIRDQPLLRALLVSSSSTEAARTIAETMETDGNLRNVLVAKVNRVQHKDIEVWMKEAEGVGDNINEEKIKVYNNTDWDYEVKDSDDGTSMLIKERTPPKKKVVSEKIPPKNEIKNPLLDEMIGKLGDGATEKQLEDLKKAINQINESKSKKKDSQKHLPKKARAAKVAMSSDETDKEKEKRSADDDLSWEERDIMRGLGIHNTHHVSSSVSVPEMISRASAKVCQVLQDIESHLRTKEGRPIRAEVDKLSKIAMNAILDPRNDDCFNHSEAFKDLFHVYAAKVITMKEVVDNLSTNGWGDPSVAEWKRIWVDFPCLEAIDHLPEGAKCVYMQYVLAQKISSITGEDSRKKVRLVACQTLDKFWYDKDEKISPTVNPDAVKIMCSLCLQLDMTMETRDQAGGYLHAVYPDDAEPVYVRAPQYLDKILKNNPELMPMSPNGRPAKYFRVRRALYGCQLSCKIFYRMFRDFMIGSAKELNEEGHRGAGWEQSEIDPCVFYKKEGKGFAVLCCHVDDSLIIATKDEDGQRIRNEFSEAYASRFAVSPECTDGDVHEYLSMCITLDRKAGTMTFRMPKLFKKLRALLESMGDRAKKKGRFCRKEILVKGEARSMGYDNVDTRVVRTPMALDHKNIYEPSGEDNPIVPYDTFDSRRILGLAAYIVLGIRPDAAHAAAIIARFTGSKQTEAVIQHTVRLAWYLVDTENDHVLTFIRSMEGFDLNGMVDASFSNDPITKRSYFGYVLRFGANPIAWRSKLEASVALSTRDAELMAAVHAVQHILGVRFFLQELDLLKLGATTVMTDNKASMEGVQNDKNHKGSHYMGYRLSWLREQVADLLVRFEHVESKKNDSDIFTKVLQEEDYSRLRAALLNLRNLLD